MAEILRRWHDVDFFHVGERLPLKLRAPSYAEAPGFLQMMDEARAAGAKAGSDPSSGESVFSVWTPELARDAFERYVKPRAELSDEDGGGFKSGADVFEAVNAGLVLEVLRAIERLATLTAPEGKGSSSLSTSEPAPAADSGDSPATSTELAGGVTR